MIGVFPRFRNKAMWVPILTLALSYYRAFFALNVKGGVVIDLQGACPGPSLVMVWKQLASGKEV